MVLKDVQKWWAAQPVWKRLKHVRGLRHEIAVRADELAGCIARPAAETLVAEVLPLADACKFLERRAEEVLAPQKARTEHRPLWLRGVEVEIRREPLGVVLIIGPSNYPLFLPAVQAVQALTAGNAVIWKPGRNGSAVADLFLECCTRAGFPKGLIEVTSEEVSQVQTALERGVDKVVLTGSVDTGRALLGDLASRVVPAVVELSGCDAVVVWRGADLDRVAKALRFGTTLNGGNTCIAPKRMVVLRELADSLTERAGELLSGLAVQTAETADEAVALASSGQYALGASVFGSEREASVIARRLRAGVVVINDIIVPTADPRVPFGGRGLSGFGTTRGAEGLLEMTAIQAVVTRRARWLPHLEPHRPEDERLFASYIRCVHAVGWPERLRSLAALVRSASARSTSGGSAMTSAVVKKDEVHEH